VAESGTFEERETLVPLAIQTDIIHAKELKEKC
jgi:hypothetical protein